LLVVAVDNIADIDSNLQKKSNMPYLFNLWCNLVINYTSDINLEINIDIQIK